MQNRKILGIDELDGSVGGWIRSVIETQGSILLERWLDKFADLSVQIEVSQEKIELLGIRRFFTGPRLEYRGTALDPRLSSLGPEALRFLHAGALERWKSLARAIGQELASSAYEGPAGIDALLYRVPDGTFRLRPLVELNPRWTMGRIALEIEKRVLPGVPAHWLWYSARKIPDGYADAAEWVGRLEADFPVQQTRAGDGLRISGGIVATTDAQRAREVVTLLAVGERAVAHLSTLRR
jgi:hypothetical protein